jgi:hypothetical protein
MLKVQLPKEKKIEILNNLLNSNDLKSEKFSKLLKYLVKAEINGDEIKEAIIAIDCFDRDSSFDPTIDSSIRVYLSNLRKKIEHYYLTDGKDDQIQITIPKGSYQIEYVDNLVKSIVKKNSFYKNAFYISLLILITLLVAILISHFSSPALSSEIIPSKDAIWNDILTSEKKTLIVLGDYYFFSMPFSKGRQSYIRDIEINSSSDLKDFIAANPLFKNKISQTYHTYLEESYPWCLSQIIPSFIHFNTKYEIKLSSEIQLNELQKYNIIYIGPYKCLYILKDITENLNFKYSLHQGSSSLEFREILTDSIYSYRWKTNPQTNAKNDYSIILKVAGPNDNTFIFFISENDFGNASSVKYFTNPEKLAQFEKEIDSDYFEAVFEVTGIVRTDFTIKLLHINKLSSDFMITFQNL